MRQRRRWYLIPARVWHRAFPFSLIGEFLAGQVNSDFAVLTRVVLAALVTGMLQVVNLTFAAGQVGYKHTMMRFPLDLPAYRTFGYFFFGALIIALPSFLIFGDASRLPTTTLQWGVLFWLGLAASGAGLFVNLLIWNRDADLLRLAIGGGVIGLSLWLNARFHPKARIAL